MSEERKKIVISEVIDLLHNGYTRTPEGWGSTGYNPEIGSIQEFYGLVDMEMMTANAQVKALFQHPKLKNQKTRKVPTPPVLPFDIVDETEEVAAPVNEAVTNNTIGTNTATTYADDAEVTVNEFETQEG